MSTDNSDFDDNVFGAAPEDLRALKAAYGAAVRRRRIEAGIEQDAFARMVGISRSHIFYLEKGEGNPKLTTQHRIAAALGTTIDDLAKVARIEAFGSDK